jgi:hypothetical protein
MLFHRPIIPGPLTAARFTTVSVWGQSGSTVFHVRFVATEIAVVAKTDATRLMAAQRLSPLPT